MCWVIVVLGGGGYKFLFLCMMVGVIGYFDRWIRLKELCGWLLGRNCLI